MVKIAREQAGEGDLVVWETKYEEADDIAGVVYSGHVIKSRKQRITVSFRHTETGEERRITINKNIARVVVKASEMSKYS